MSNDLRAAPSLVAPTLPDALDPLSTETAFLLPVANRAEALKITIGELWAGYRPLNELVFYLGQNASDMVLVENPDPSDFPQTFEIDKFDLRSGGVHELYYTVSIPGSTVSSHSIWLDLDKDPPNIGRRPSALQFPQEVLEYGVTQDYLDNHGGNVIATASKWPDIKLEDELWYYLRRSAKPGNETQEEVGRKIITPADLAAPEIEVTFTGDDFLALGKGKCVAYYYLKDRAGNEGDNSDDSPVFPVFLDPPLQLLAPEVPLFDQNGLIDEETARTPVQVWIRAMAGIEHGDQVIVHWGTHDLLPMTVDDPEATPLLRIDVPYRALQEAGNGPLLISYDLWRAGSSLGRSPDKPVVVDITVPGGPDPDPETPEHGNLKLPVALGNSGVPNVISPEDKELPAEVIIEWFGKDSTELFLEGDRLEAKWASISLHRQIDAADVIAKQSLKLTITSEQMKQAGFGTLALSYGVTRDLPNPPGHSNTAYSGVRNIEVANTELPGGGYPLPVGAFPEAKFDVINNEAAKDGTPYEVKLNYVHAAEGDVIEFKFRGHQGFGGDPELEPANPIPGSYTEGSHTVTQDDLDRGSYAFTVELEYLAAIRSGSANGYHWVRNDKGTASGGYYHVHVDVSLPPQAPAQATAKKRFSVFATLAALWSWLRCK